MSKYDEQEQDSKPSFEEALEELKSDSDSLPSPALIVGLSGLSDEQIKQLDPIWKNLDAKYRLILMQMLIDASQETFEFDFQAIGLANLNAPQAEIRQAAIELLWEDESPSFMRQLQEILAKDESAAVRAEAAKALGRYLFLGEMEEIPERDANTVRDMLLKVSKGNDELDVRRFAVESLGHCTSKDANEVIAAAYRNPEPLMRVSAVVAMGRTYDNRWEETILKELESSDEEMRRVAANAAGDLQIAEAVPALISIINEDDKLGRDTAIWALGEIGGKEAMRVLDNLMEAAEEAEDDDLIELIDDAISSASLADGSFMMFDMDDIELEDFDEEE